MPRTRNLGAFLASLDAAIGNYLARHGELLELTAAADPVASRSLGERHGRLGATRFEMETPGALVPPVAEIPTSGRVSMTTTNIRLQFTIDGREVGGRFRPPGGVGQSPNDVHFEFRRGSEKPKMSFTRDGEIVGEAGREAPDGATGADVEFFEDETGRPRIKWMHWTRLNRETGEREPIDFESAPPGTNDFHLELGKGGRITAAWWTHNGYKVPHVGDIKIPNYPVNDVHIVPSRRFAAREIDYRQLAASVLAALVSASAATLPLRAVGAPRLPDRYLVLSINYLYSIREWLANLEEEEKARVRRRLRDLRRQVEESTTLTQEEKTELYEKIDETLRVMG